MIELRDRVIIIRSGLVYDAHKVILIEFRKDGKRHTFMRAWEGLVGFFKRRYEATESPWLRDELESLRDPSHAGPIPPALKAAP